MNGMELWAAFKIDISFRNGATIQTKCVWQMETAYEKHKGCGHDLMRPNGMI